MFLSTFSQTHIITILKVTSDEVAFFSLKTSLGKTIKNFDILFVEECQMLIQMIYQPISHPV